MIKKFSISNIVRIDSITNKKKARLIYKDDQDQIKEIILKVAEKYWMEMHPLDGIVDRLYYISNGIHYVADRCYLSENKDYRVLIFFLPNDSRVEFYSDETNKIKFTHTVNLLHGHGWGTFDTSRTNAYIK